MSNDTAIRFNNIREFFEYARANPEVLDSLSPNAVADRLGVTRQAVQHLINRGHLKAWYICDTDSRTLPSMVMISNHDVEVYQHTPKNKGGRPKKALAA